jgi:K+/H+ antiporter YhaU regulatory subunit KhtT
VKPEPVRWAIVARPHNRLATVLLQNIGREVERGAVVIAREDEALCNPSPDAVTEDGDDA